LTYQWQFNGTAIPSANGSSMTLTSVTTNQAGLYSVIVSNALGSTSSAQASLSFWPDGAAYVWPDSPNPTSPYLSWATAAHTIQDAVDAAIPGLVVLVTNGTYATGGRTVGGGALTNRIVLDKPIVLRSVNGPQFTLIEGFQVPGTINGSGAVRCVYLADGVTLSGFTLTNGATSQTGLIDGQIAGGAWCQSTNALLTNCLLAGNSASAQAGGVYRGTLTDCTLIGNRARGDNGSGGSDAGGALMATLVRCTLAGNSAEGQFGWGGGANGSILFECTITNNSATYSGGGAYSCILHNCDLTGNSSAYGGGATSSQLYNCTLTGNSAGGAGGVNDCSLVNSIVYYNTSVDANINYESRSTFRNCCTTPMPAGSGNISLEPQLATTSHLSASSPCRAAGLAGAAVGNDIDGEAWANPPSIGCDEYYAGAVTGPLSVAIAAPITNVATGSAVPFTALITGRASASVWDFGDGIIISNRPYASHAWTVPGDFLVLLKAYNDSLPSGVSASVSVHVPGQLTHYVAVNSTNPVAPFTSWTTAATTIQDALDSSISGDQILVADGTYASGGRSVGTNLLINRIAVTNQVSLRSVNGPGSTFILGAHAPGAVNGDGAVRCVYLADGASLFGFTVTNGATRTTGGDGDQAGGGIWCPSVGANISNCIVVANSGSYAGGAYRGTLHDCLLTGNSATGNLNGGGGVFQSTLYNCTLTGNDASTSAAGGALLSTLYNCIAYDNTSSWSSNYWACSMNFCCTMPMPTNGVGNITNNPLFIAAVDNNFRLQTNSPCINAGNNSYVTESTDLEARPRIVGGTVDMGAYEFQASGPPFIYIQPVSQIVYSGSDVSFKAPAFGSTPLTWQWWFNQAAILNATNASFALTSITTNQAGNYFVVITNLLGSVTSQVAVLTVLTSAPPANVSYVALDSPIPTPPYNSWASAAHVIQDAVDAVSPGGLVLVTNGTYATGGRAATPSLVPNRVAVDKAVTVKSVNGPEFTAIQGLQVPGITNGPGAVRCVFLASGATLSGFTLTNGATYQLGGVWANEQSGGGVWCASTGATVTNCIIAGNSAGYAGAGANGGTLIDCRIVGNQTTGANNSGNSVGAGVYGANLIRCTVTGNFAGGQYGSGGGASGSSLSDCLVGFNSAVDSGGGVYWQCTLTNCTLIGNSAGGYGGGARGESGGACTLYHCFLTGNSAGSGGGASGSQLYNCTLTGNSVDHLNPAGFAYSGGGVSFCSLLNCIVYYNTAVWGTANYDPASSFTNCCTTPLPQIGSGNISFEPQLASASHLSSASPCRGAGLVGSANGTDIDGEPWTNPPSIGCDEYYVGATAGPLTVTIVATTNAAIGSQLPFEAVIEGQTSSSVWDFGDGVIVSNRPYASHAWTIAGDYPVMLRAFNDSQPNGVAATITAHISGQSAHYVTVSSTNPVPPFTSWATAAANIQDAVDASRPGDEILIGDGVYAVGGRAAGTNQLLNRVAVTNQLSLRSANGPGSTFIQGAQAPGGANGNGAIRCVYLANGCSLSGFTLTNGATLANGNLEMDQAGGGAWCESTSVTLSNCVLIGNSAFFGGGAYRGSMYNCLVNSNSATGNMFGCGGAYQSTLYNCTLTGNSANSFAGGGVAVATLFNSIVYYNTALIESNYYSSTLNYCATTPTPTNGVGNSPLFVDGLGGNFHLQAASPCINAGNNAYTASKKDFDGNPRVAGGTVDIGAYEFQNPKSVISYDWLEQYGLPTDGSADYADPDGDGMNNWQEWIAGTNPTNALSCLRLVSATSAGGNLTVSWQSMAGVNYFLQRSANLGSPFTLVLTNIVGTASNIVLIGTNSVFVGTNIVGRAGTTTYTDTNTTGPGSFFYRVGVNGP